MMTIEIYKQEFYQIFHVGGDGRFKKKIEETVDELFQKTMEQMKAILSFRHGSAYFAIVPTIEENRFAVLDVDDIGISYGIFINLINTPVVFVESPPGTIQLEAAPLTMILAHELLHAMHALNGDELTHFPEGVFPALFGNKPKEFQVIDGDPFLSENGIRKSFGFARRIGHLKEEARSTMEELLHIKIT